MQNWIENLPADTEIFGRDWTAAQTGAVFAKVKADREYFEGLLAQLARADEKLAGYADADAVDDIDAALHDGHFGYWKARGRALAHAAAMIWENEGRDVNQEIGRIIY